jgi:hypothetical protein
MSRHPSESWDPVLSLALAVENQNQNGSSLTSYVVEGQ